MPYPVEKGAPLDVNNSYVIATYVGYDSNKQMQRGGLKIAGSAGALPAWIDFAKSIMNKKKYAEAVDALDLKVVQTQQWPLKVSDKTVPLKVDLPRGLVLRAADQSDNETFET